MWEGKVSPRSLLSIFASTSDATYLLGSGCCCRVESLSHSLSLFALLSLSRSARLRVLEPLAYFLWAGHAFEERTSVSRKERRERERERKGGEGRECPIVAASHHFLPAIRAFLKELPTDCSFFLCLSSSLSLPHLRLRDSCAGELGPASRGLLAALSFFYLTGQLPACLGERERERLSSL